MANLNDTSLSCSICCERFDKRTHKDASCVYCQGSICVECQKTYLKQLYKDPECMICHRAFTREILLKMLSKKFIEKDLKRHREEVLFEREKCLLPATQANMARKNVKRQKIFRFVRKCPGNKCNGFLGENWKCSLCNTEVCPDCLEIKKTTHVHECVRENVETAKLLKSDSKPCPSCGVVIFKISGCSQMWCTYCHTAFDWNTCLIEKGQIHNPHYYEFMAERGAGDPAYDNGDLNFNQNAFNEIVPHIPLHHANACWKELPQEERGKLYRYLRGLSHIQNVDIPRLQQATDMNDPQWNEDVRRQYLTNEIDETKFKVTLQRREKKREVKKELCMIMEMFCVCGTDVLRKTITEGHKKKPIENNIAQGVLTELLHLQQYVNETIDNIQRLYNISVPRLMDTGYDVGFMKQPQS